MTACINNEITILTVQRLLRTSTSNLTAIMKNNELGQFFVLKKETSVISMKKKKKKMIEINGKDSQNDQDEGIL